jgi:hypothetical protein
MMWTLTTLSERFQLEGGVEFLDSLPISTVGSLYNHSSPISELIYEQGGKVDRNALQERSINEIQLRVKSC